MAPSFGWSRYDTRYAICTNPGRYHKRQMLDVKYSTKYFWCTQGGKNLSKRTRSIEVPGLSHGTAPIPMAARAGNIIYSSAISGREPGTGTLPATGAEQVALAFSHMRKILMAGGATLENVVKLSITLADNSAREAVNEEWLKCFPDPHDRPARHITLHEMANGLLAQLEFVAVIEE